MTNVIHFLAAPAAEDAVRPDPAGSAKLSGFDEGLAAASRDALKALLAAIDSIAQALDQVEIVRKDLPDGSNTDLIQEQKAALACALFASRMLVLKLSSDIAKLAFSPREADPALFTQR